MKKLHAMMMVLVLFVALGCTAFADRIVDSAAQQESWLRESLTTCGWTEKNGDRVTLDIEPVFLAEDDFIVRVELSNGAFESTKYLYSCRYDTEVHILMADSVTAFTETYADENSEPEINQLGERECHAEFELDEDGFLILRDNDADESNGEIYLMGFEKVSGEEKGEEISDEIKAFFEKEQEGLLGVDYKPLRLMAREENWICVLAEATVVAPEADTYYALFYMDTTGAGETYIVLLSDDGSQG